MRQADAAHLSTEMLLRTLDEELTDAQTVAMEAHLAACEQCRGRIHELGVLSVRLESWVSSVPVLEANAGPAAFRDKLFRDKLDKERFSQHARGTRDARKDPDRISRWISSIGPWHWAASAGVAGAILIAAMLSPGVRSLHQTQASRSAQALTSQTFQIAGETFVPLPYSNSDLPLTAPHIVQMEVPVTSLAEAGIVFEPVSSEQANLDRAVLADVLLGADGEPLGVHVLTVE